MFVTNYHRGVLQPQRRRNHDRLPRTCFRQPRVVITGCAARDVENLPLPEGSLGLPLFGETLQLLSDGEGFGSKRLERYGDLWKTNILGAPTVMVYAERDVQKVLAAEGELVESEWPSTTATLVGERSLNLLKGQDHATVKALWQAVVNKACIARLQPHMAAIIETYFNRWNRKTTFDAFEECQFLSTALFFSCIGGVDCADFETTATLRSMKEDLQKGFQTVPLNLPFGPYHRAVVARKDLAARMHAAQASSGPAAEHSVIAAASRHAQPSGRRLSAAEIEDGFFAMLFGNLSIGPTLAKAIQYLAEDRRVWDELVMEQKAAQQRYGSDTTLDALSQLPYTNAVVRELIRITPTVPATFKKSIATFELSGRKIPAGWRLFCYTGDAVRKYNKDLFWPERWLSSDGNSALSDAACPYHTAASHSTTDGAQHGTEFVMPFGTGTRMCLGQGYTFAVLRTFVSMAARSHEWDLVDKGVAGESGVQWTAFPQLAPQGPIMTNWRSS